MNQERLEAATIGGLLLRPSMMQIAELVLEPEAFSEPTWQLMFRTLVGMSGREITATTVVAELRAHGDFERVGGAAALADAVNEFPNGRRVLDLVGAVSAASDARRGGEEASR